MLVGLKKNEENFYLMLLCFVFGCVPPTQPSDAEPDKQKEEQQEDNQGLPLSPGKARLLRFI